jgi:hypothetical protein
MPFVVTFAGCEKRNEDTLTFPSSYVLYLIRLESGTDGKQYYSRKRYKDLKAFHGEAVRRMGAVDCQEISFPSSTVTATEFLTGATVDPKGSYVQGRKTALESFFQQFLDQNPQLFDNPKVLRFFGMIAPETATAGAAAGATSAALGAAPVQTHTQYTLREKYGKKGDDDELALGFYIDSGSTARSYGEVDQHRNMDDGTSSREQLRTTSPETYEV